MRLRLGIVTTGDMQPVPIRKDIEDYAELQKTLKPLFEAQLHHQSPSNRWMCGGGPLRTGCPPPAPDWLLSSPLMEVSIVALGCACKWHKTSPSSFAALHGSYRAPRTT